MLQCGCCTANVSVRMFPCESFILNVALWMFYFWRCTVDVFIMDVALWMLHHRNCIVDVALWHSFPTFLHLVENLIQSQSGARGRDWPFQPWLSVNFKILISYQDGCCYASDKLQWVVSSSGFENKDGLTERVKTTTSLLLFSRRNLSW